MNAPTVSPSGKKYTTRYTAKHPDHPDGIAPNTVSGGSHGLIANLKK